MVMDHVSEIGLVLGTIICVKRKDGGRIEVAIAVGIACNGSAVRAEDKSFIPCWY